MYEELEEQFGLIERRVPHVYEKLKVFWGSEYFHDYTDKLMFDTRDGKRQGFPVEVMKALNDIVNKHDEAFPRKVKSVDVWTKAYYD